MAKKKRKKPVMKNGKMVIDMNEIQLNQRKFTTSEIGRGTGIHMPKKGKGSYTRKVKHKKGYGPDDYLCETSK
jgi:hypothetical protein